MTKEIRKPMTEGELCSRIVAGEDALDLSIEKWDRVADWLRARRDPNEPRYGWPSCGLCFETGYTGTGKEDACYGCRYVRHYGETCWADEQNAYEQFVEAMMSSAFSHEDIKKLACLAEDMRDELIAIKEGKHEDED